MAFESGMINISNVSRVWIGVVKKSLWWLWWGLGVCAISLFSIGSSPLLFMNIILFLFGVYLIIIFFSARERTLNVETDSSNITTFYSKDAAFLLDAYNILQDRFAKGGSDVKTIINFIDNKINKQFIGGDFTQNFGDNAVLGGKGNVYNTNHGSNNGNIGNNTGSGSVSIDNRQYPINDIKNELENLRQILIKSNKDVADIDSIISDINTNETSGLSDKLKNLLIKWKPEVKELRQGVLNAILAEITGTLTF